MSTSWPPSCAGPLPTSRRAAARFRNKNWLRDETGGSVYLRLSTRPIEQIERTMTDELRQQIVDGAYWLRKPGPNAQVIVAYTGAIAPEAIEAVGLMAEDRRDVGLLAVTSADRLNAGWTAAQRARERGLVHARSHIERLLADVPAHCGIVTRARRPSGDFGLARRRRRPPHARARRRAFRTNRLARRSLPALRHRRQRHRRRRAGHRARPADPAFQSPAVIRYATLTQVGPSAALLSLRWPSQSLA